MINETAETVEQKVEEALPGAQEGINKEDFDRMSSAGEIDPIEFEVEGEGTEQQPATEEATAQPALIEVDGEKLTLDQVREALKVQKNQHEWNRKNTEKAQENKKERQELSALEQKLAKMKENVKGDNVLEETAELMETLAKDLEQIKAEKKIDEEQSKILNQRAQILDSFAKIEAKYGVKMPKDFDSPEFKSFASRATTLDIAELVAVYDLYHNKGSSQPQKVLTDEPNTDGGDSTVNNLTRSIAEKVGLSMKLVEKMKGQ